MPDTPYGGSNALLAIIRGDEETALEILKDLLTGERLNLSKSAHRLSFMADPANTCPACGNLVENGDRTIKPSTAHPGVPHQCWHRQCWADRQENGS